MLVKFLGGHNDILGDIRGTLISPRYFFEGHDAPPKIFLEGMGRFMGDIVPCPSLILRLERCRELSLNPNYSNWERR